MQSLKCHKGAKIQFPNDWHIDLLLATQDAAGLHCCKGTIQLVHQEPFFAKLLFKQLPAARSSA